MKEYRCRACNEEVDDLAGHLLSRPLCLENYYIVMKLFGSVQINGQHWYDRYSFPGVDCIIGTKTGFDVFVKKIEDWMYKGELITFYERYRRKGDKWLYRNGKNIVSKP